MIQQALRATLSENCAIKAVFVGFLSYLAGWFSASSLWHQLINKGAELKVLKLLEAQLCGLKLLN